MEKVRVPSGSNISLEKIFENAQQSAFNNMAKRFNKLTDAKGIILKSKNGVLNSDSTDLKLEYSSPVIGNITFMVRKGVGVTDTGDCIDVANNTIRSAAPNPVSTGYYLISLEYVESGYEPVSTMNAFMYDKSGSTVYSKQNTRFLDSYKMISKKVISITTSDLAENSVALGYIRILDNGAPDLGYWTLDGITSQIGGIIDARYLNACKLDSGLLDDQTLLFKDRPSTINANITVNNTLTAKDFISTETATFKDASVTGLLSITGDLPYMQVYGKSAAGINLTLSDTNVTAGVQVGSEGVVQLGINGYEKALTLRSNGFIGNTKNPEKTWHVSSEASWGTTLRLQNSTSTSSTIFDFTALNHDDNSGRLEIKPVGNNRPIVIKDIENSTLFTLNGDKGLTTVGKSLLVVGNLDVAGDKITANTVESRALLTSPQITSTTLTTSRLNATSIVTEGIKISTYIDSPDKNLIYYDGENSTIGINNKSPNKLYSLDIVGNVNISRKLTVSELTGATQTFNIGDFTNINTQNIYVPNIFRTNLTDNSVSVDNKLTTPLIEADELTVTKLTVNDAEQVILAGTRSETFRVGVGSNLYPIGLRVKTETPEPKATENFRIYDISPSDNMDEAKVNVSLKWDYGDLTGSANGTTFVLQPTTAKGETIDSLDSYIATGRYLYFNGLGKAVKILSYVSGTRTLTLAEDVTGLNLSDTNPGSIIDINTEKVTIRVIEVDSAGKLTDNVQYFDIVGMSSYAGCSYRISLGINKRYSFSIRAGNNDNTGSFISMNNGVYDPDHTSAGQTPISYQNPLMLTLPSIDLNGVSTGTISCIATAYGFNTTITSWTNDDKDLVPHEFMVAWAKGSSSTTNFTWPTTPVSPRMQSTQEFDLIKNRYRIISVGEPAIYTVAVRPVQNKSYVGTEIKTEVSSGGGGIIPQHQVLVGPQSFNIKVIDFTIVGTIAGGIGWIYKITSGTTILPTGYLDGLSVINANGSTYNVETLSTSADGTMGISFIGHPTGLTGTCTSCTSELGRHIYTTKLQADYTLTRIEAMILSAPGSGTGPISQYPLPTILRLTIDGLETFLQVENPGQSTASSDINLTAKKGQTIILDAWDTKNNGASNSRSVAGSIAVLGTPLVGQTI